MKLVTHITPIITKEINLGGQYLLMSEVRGEIILLIEAEARIIKKVGMPLKWGMFSCNVDEVPTSDINFRQVVPFCMTAMDRCYELCHHAEGHASLVIDWNV